MGGTFDHLHAGHKYLIKTALSLSKKVVIGLITQDLLKNKKYPHKIEDYQTREKKLNEFIKSITEVNRVDIVPLKDHFGPPIHEADYEALIVSQETYKGALKINEIRKQKGFNPLIIIVIPILRDNENKKISSTAIRESIK